MKLVNVAGVLAISVFTFSAATALAGLTEKEKLGKNLFFDDRLSDPAGQSCADCHSSGAGFNGAGDATRAVYQGAVHGVFGNRNPPAAAYASFSPEFHLDAQDGGYVGGQFWDGRAATLKQQAKGPFLNPKEQNNADMRAVVRNVAQSNYADLFKKVYGASTLARTELAYDAIADAIAAYEKSSEVNRFSSKYDLYLGGKVSLSTQEAQGLQLFNAKCAGCHPSTAGSYSDKPLFTDYTYDNIGVPRNPDNPFYKTNPDFVDKGVGPVVKDPAQDGKFKVPTLRNVAIAAPYSHNGYFKTLREIVDFYNTRDVPGAGWPKPEVEENLNRNELGNLRLSDAEVDAIVAFLATLTDGYAPPNPREVKK
jgi:cytochrome c peroxidase